jgi:predicted sulfurtransferase
MIVNIAGYRFVTLERLAELKAEILAFCKENQIKGTILLGQEGINIMLGGAEAAINAFIGFLHSYPQFADMAFKYSYSEEQPFQRMLIKLRKEIISMGRPEVEPAKHPAPNVLPQQLKQWLDEGRNVTIVDTRNQYEYDVGTFNQAINLGIAHFRDFPAAIQQLGDDIKEKPVVVFCTGGIRCEKAAPYMLQQGFKEVYQLEGGILKYFEECGGAHWTGDCFVFDERVAVDPQLQPTGAIICKQCQQVVKEVKIHQRECVGLQAA